MIRDLYSSLTAREQRAMRWSAAATAVALWFSTAWADPWLLLAVPLIAGAFWVYRVHHRDAELEEDEFF